MAFRTFGRVFTRSFLLKEKKILEADMATQEVSRTYSLFDLICLGVGGTVGSGVFVLTGIVANTDAGPGVIFSWLIAGFACFFSCITYAELSCRIPTGGSSYQYVYSSLGELPAVISVSAR
jgi:basic amino acid/polyamine antiporter, APA family